MEYITVNMGKMKVIVVSFKTITIIGPRHEKTCLQGFANNNGADQPAQSCSLISSFVKRVLERIIGKQ